MVKKVVNCVYAHKSNIGELFEEVNANENEHKFFIRCDIDMKLQYEDYDVIKFDKKTRNITFIRCEDFNEENEPLIIETFKYYYESYLNYRYVKRKTKWNGKQIYHNKWMFVADDYTGFDVPEAKRRTELWNSIPDIKKHKSKIGYKKYWDNLLKENGIEI